MGSNAHTSSSAKQNKRQQYAPAQEENALDQPESGQVDPRFTVSEEVSLDQQSDAARRVGHMPQEPDVPAEVSAPAAEALKNSVRQEANNKMEKENLQQAINRAVPPAR